MHCSHPAERDAADPDDLVVHPKLEYLTALRRAEAQRDGGTTIMGRGTGTSPISREAQEKLRDEWLSRRGFFEVIWAD